MRGRPLGLILLSFALLATAYSLVVPLWEAPDEPEHFFYIRHLVTQRELPSRPLPSLQLNPGREESRQPPLYYLLGAVVSFWVESDDILRVKPNPYYSWVGMPGQEAVFWHTEDEGFPYQNAALAAHLVRLLSVVLGVATVLVTYLIAREVFPQRREVALGAAAVNAFIPGFLFLHGVINNDNLVILFCSLALLLLIQVARGQTGRLQLIGLGVVIGLGLLSKQNALLLLPFVAVVLLGLKLRGGGAFPLAGSLVLSFGGAALVSGWWYLRNAFLYQEALRADVLASPAAGEEVTTSLLALRPFFFAGRLFESFWATFGWQNIRLDDGLYYGLWGLSGLAALGLLLHRGEGGGGRRWPLAILGLWLLAVLALTLLRDLVAFGRYGEGIDHGRYLYPAIAPLSLFLYLGWEELARRLGFRGFVLVPLGSLGLLSLLSPLLIIAPRYLPPLPVSTHFDEGWLQHRVGAHFANGVELAGYSGGPLRLTPGDTLSLTLYWRVREEPGRDYIAFVHLLNRSRESAGGDDRIPLEERYPMHRWVAGEVVREERTLVIPEGARPGHYNIEVGQYLYPSLERVALSQGGAPGDVAIIGRVKVVEGAPPKPQHPVQARLGEQIELFGYDLEEPPEGLRPGDAVPVVLYWRALDQAPQDYVVFLHLAGEGGRVLAQDDGEPGEGNYPTSIWEVGEVIRDPHWLRLPEDLPAGEYRLLVGMYEVGSGRRLEVAGGGDAVELRRVRLR